MTFLTPKCFQEWALEICLDHTSTLTGLHQALGSSRTAGGLDVVCTKLAVDLQNLPATAPERTLQRCAEILLEEARAHLASEPCLREIRFVLFGEPAYRVFESVQDAAKVQEQLEKLKAARAQR